MIDLVNLQMDQLEEDKKHQKRQSNLPFNIAVKAGKGKIICKTMKN